MTKRQRRLFLRTITAATAGGLTAWVQQTLAADPKSLKQGMSSVNGDVSVNGKLVAAGAAVGPGDVVETGAAGRAVFVFADNAFMMRPNSRVEFGESLASFLRVVSGGLLAVFGKGERRLVVPTAAIGIRCASC